MNPCHQVEAPFGTRRSIRQPGPSKRAQGGGQKPRDWVGFTYVFFWGEWVVGFRGKKLGELKSFFGAMSEV